MNIYHWIILYIAVGAILAKGFDMLGYHFESVLDTGFCVLIWPFIIIALLVYFLSFLWKSLWKKTMD